MDLKLTRSSLEVLEVDYNKTSLEVVRTCSLLLVLLQVLEVNLKLTKSSLDVLEVD